MGQIKNGKSSAIFVSGLHKSYGDFEAVRGIDFEVATGEVFGLLGPNGAGKTTTVEILEGIRQRTSGDVRVLDYDPDKQKTKLKDRIGVCLQATNLPDKMKVIEALQVFGSLYSRMLDPRDLLKRLQLEEKRDAFYSTLSGGQKQRLAIALGLINDPSLLFLDEPTTGLDPQVRLEIHDLLAGLRAEKRTILMTTHYIEEAERLCDRVAIVDAGKVIAIGTPRELQDRSASNSSIEIVCGRTLLGCALPEWPDATRVQLSDDGLRLTVQSSRPARTLVDIVKWVDAQNIGLEDVHLARPTLEDVFIELTGKRLRE
jgi:ABC-2 type transport system ATP-binding protein